MALRLTGALTAVSCVARCRASEEALYEKLKYGSAGCSGGRQIASQDECRRAIESLGLFGNVTDSNFWVGSLESIPRFCSVHEFELGYGSSGGHWNDASVGHGRSDLAPICRASAQAGQSATLDDAASQVAAAPAPSTLGAASSASTRQWGQQSSQRLTGSCRLTPAQFRGSRVCSDEHRRFWDSRRSQYDMKCELDPDSLRMNCKAEDSCFGERPRDQEVEVHHVVTYDCTRCDRSAETFWRLPCCKTCMAARDRDILVGRGGDNYSVRCQGCDDLLGLQDQAEKAKSQFCSSLEEGHVNCTFNHRCELGDPRKTTHVTSCARTPCDRCDPESPMRAECCSLCLQKACSSNSSQRHVCMGCDATRMLPTDEPTPEISTSSSVDFFEDGVYTSLADAASAGSTILRVASEIGFEVDDGVEISGGNHSETRTVVGFGSLLLDSPLEHSYPAGCRVTKKATSKNLTTPLATQSEASTEAPKAPEDAWAGSSPATATPWPFLFLLSGMACVLAGAIAMCGFWHHRSLKRDGRRRGKKMRSNSNLATDSANEDSCDDEELEVQQPLMGTFSEALKAGPFQHCQSFPTSPQFGTCGTWPAFAPRAPPSPPPAPSSPLRAQGSSFTYQLPPVSLAPISTFSQQVVTSAGRGSYQPLVCHSPTRAPRAP